MDRGSPKRIGLALTVFVLATGCASLPRPGSPGAFESPATATIPPPVPVEDIGPVSLEGSLWGDDAGSEDDVAARLVTEVILEPVPDIPVPDLMERVRAGLALGEHFNSRIDKEADYFARNPEYVERVFNRAAPYMQYIVNQVEERGLPLEIALLPVIESAFQPFAYSSASASGLWQFIPSTGTHFSLKQDWWYDGRRDVVAATRAALDYLTYLNNLFGGDWLLAVAAYNCGEANVQRAIRRNKSAGKRTDFWNLSLPRETRAYVPKLLAISRVVARPEDYGLTIVGIPDEPYFESVETGGQISIEVAAQLAGITTDDMYALNPAYHRWATDPSGPHALLVPIESAETFRTNLLQLTPDQRLRVERYAVREGDTVTSIAARFGTNAQHLQELNSLGNANKLVVDSELRVPSAVTALPEQVRIAAARVDSRLPGGVRAVHVVRSGDTLSGIAKRHGMSVATLARVNNIRTTSILRIGQRLQLNSSASTTTAGGIVATEAAGEGSNKVTYLVRSGDTLSGIARSLKVTVNALREWNNISGSVIRAGQRLIAYVDRS